MITTTKTLPTKAQYDKYVEMYLSIGYNRRTGKRVPNGTRHKLTIRYCEGFFTPKAPIKTGSCTLYHL